MLLTDLLLNSLERVSLQTCMLGSPWLDWIAGGRRGEHRVTMPWCGARRMNDISEDPETQKMPLNNHVGMMLMMQM